MEAESNGTAEAWRERIVQQQSSGQSVRAWCRQNNHHEHAFYWWRARLGLSPRSVRGQALRHAKIKFARVVVAGAGAGRPTEPELPEQPMCLRLGGGRELVLPASMPAESIARLVHAIEGVT